MKKEHSFTLKNAPPDQPLRFDLKGGKLYIDSLGNDEELAYQLDHPQSVAKMSSTLQQSRPQWILDFYAQMGAYVSQASESATINPDSGLLTLSTSMTKTSLRKVCEHLAWLYEAQSRQNKEILLWIGELILDYVARSGHPITIEEAIDDLGILKRENGVHWGMKTLARWAVVAQRIPIAIRQLPIPPTYLAEAAMFAQPDDPDEKIQFNNARDALLVAVANKPDSWSRSKFVSCMKELQEEFGLQRTRNEGVSALQERLINFYRLRTLAQESGDPQDFYRSIGLSRKDVSAWIYNIEATLIDRDKLEPNPLSVIPTGDGLTESARSRVAKSTQAEESDVH